jgi:hypothetical protein
VVSGEANVVSSGKFILTFPDVLNQMKQVKRAEKSCYRADLIERRRHTDVRNGD